jgi:hypothetical protein
MKKRGRLNRVVKFYATPSLAKLIDEQALREQLTPSALIRAAIVAHLKDAGVSIPPGAHVLPPFAVRTLSLRLAHASLRKSQSRKPENRRRPLAQP